MQGAMNNPHPNLDATSGSSNFQLQYFFYCNAEDE